MRGKTRTTHAKPEVAARERKQEREKSDGVDRHGLLAAREDFFLSAKNDGSGEVEHEVADQDHPAQQELEGQHINRASERNPSQWHEEERQRG